MPNDQRCRPLSLDDVLELVDRARAEGRTGLARKSRAVDVRPARVGEVIVTVIAGEGRETQSHPAAAGDWVVRNRIAETGDEQYLVDGGEFQERYRLADQPPGADGWRKALPLGQTVRYFVVSPEQGEFSFGAPWGEPMVARPGDAIVQDHDNPRNVWRVAAAAFAGSYELLR
jgi:hypothetical protein